MRPWHRRLRRKPGTGRNRKRYRAPQMFTRGELAVLLLVLFAILAGFGWLLKAAWSFIRGGS